MAVKSEAKELEEGEAKIDNLLNKILHANDRIRLLVTQLRERVSDEGSREKLRMVDILAETVENLASLADEIDKTDEKITKELEQDVRAELKEAVKRITHASKLV